MALTNPPAVVAALRDMLVASPTFLDLVDDLDPGSRVHFPAVSAAEVDTPLPCAFITRDPSSRVPYAAGVRGLVQGTLLLELLADLSAGELEQAAEEIAAELQEQEDGLAIRSIDVGMATDPSPGQRCVRSFRTVQLTIAYGLTA